MNTFVSHKLLLLLVSVFVLAGACQEVRNSAPSSDAQKSEEYGGHLKRGPGQVLEVWIDDWVLAIDHCKKEMKEKFSEEACPHPAIHISVPEQQSVLWISRQYEFRILSVLPTPDKENALMPEDVKKHGPFYRVFPVDPKDDAIDRGRFFRVVSSGPARMEAEPGPGKTYKFKTTFEVKGYGKIDPHIITHGMLQ